MSDILNLTWKDLYVHDGSESDGYVDLRNLLFNKLVDFPFIFMVGARGIGKTYASIDLTYTDNVPSIFMRRTQTQCDAISTNELFQGSEYCMKNDIIYDIQPLTKNLYGVYFNESEYALMVQTALSTIANIRGFNMLDRKILWYDEFLPEKHARAMRYEGQALLNAYESINRNREFQGAPPLKLVAMSNSDRLDNPLFADFNLITACDKQFEKGHIYYADKSRGVCVINFVNSPVSEKKKNTALYKFSKGMDFQDMALENKFMDEKSKQKSINLKKLEPIMNLGELTIYRTKDTKEFYVSTHYMKTGLVFTNTEKSLLAWRKCDYCRGMYYMYLHDDLCFENYNCEYLFKRYCENS